MAHGVNMKLIYRVSGQTFCC